MHSLFLSCDLHICNLAGTRNSRLIWACISCFLRYPQPCAAAILDRNGLTHGPSHHPPHWWCPIPWWTVSFDPLICRTYVYTHTHTHTHRGRQMSVLQYTGHMYTLRQTKTQTHTHRGMQMSVLWYPGHMYTHRDRQTDRQTDRHTHTQRQRETEREGQRETQRERERERQRETVAQDNFWSFCFSLPSIFQDLSWLSDMCRQTGSLRILF